MTDVGTAHEVLAVVFQVRDLPPEHREWLLEGDPKWKNWDASWPRYWYGVRHFFDWLESKAYKMHIRVLLSRYRSYTECPACHGARLKPDALLWRLWCREEEGVRIRAALAGPVRFVCQTRHRGVRLVPNMGQMLQLHNGGKGL